MFYDFECNIYDIGVHSQFRRMNYHLLDFRINLSLPIDKFALVIVTGQEYDNVETTSTATFYAHLVIDT